MPVSRVLPEPRTGEAIDLHHKASRAAIEKVRVDGKFETIEDVFDMAARICERSNEDAWKAFWQMENTGNLPDWVFNFCISFIIGEYDIYPKGVKHDRNR